MVSEDLSGSIRKQKEEERRYEALCKRCATCCGAGSSDPCANLKKDDDGKHYCDIYDHRNKASSSLINDRTAAQAQEKPEDPMDDLPDEGDPGTVAEKSEQADREKEMLTELMKSVEGDEELTLLLMAYEERKYKPAEIEAATGIRAERVSELKRKLTAHADKFLAKRPEYADLRPQKEAR